MNAVEKITKELSESRSLIESLKDSISARDEELKKLRENPPAIPVKKNDQQQQQQKQGDESKEEKKSDDVPEGFKPEFCPLIVTLTTSKHLKKWKALSSLMKGKPLGVKPEDVSNEIAEEFVNTFIPSVRGVRARSARISLFSFTYSEGSLVSLTQFSPLSLYRIPHSQ